MPPSTSLAQSRTATGLVDCVALLADVALLGAPFQHVAVHKVSYVPGRIAARVGGTVVRQCGHVRFWQELELAWLHTAWTVRNDHVVLFP